MGGPQYGYGKDVNAADPGIEQVAPVAKNTLNNGIVDPSMWFTPRPGQYGQYQLPQEYRPQFPWEPPGPAQFQGQRGGMWGPG